MILIPVLLLGVLPFLALAWRLGWWRRPWPRAACLLLAAAVTVVAMPFGGQDFEVLKHVKMLLAASTAALLWLGHRLGWASRRVDLALLVLAILAVANWLNYGAFHGLRVFVHLHDVAHYYLGAKYYGELGYTDLYTAMLRAEAENHGDRFRAIEARDLETYRRVHIRTLLRRSDEVKQAFTAARWFEFKRDADYFRQRLPDHYGGILLDHGFNPTPVWALVGGSLAQGVPAGSSRGLLLLSLLDPVLLLLSFAAIGWAFGRRAMLLAVIYFCVLFGATFGWVGGAFLRYLWFFGVVAGLAAWRRHHHPAAGALFALATMLRVFPFFFLLPLAAKVAWRLARHRTLERRHLRFGAGFAAMALALFLATGLLPRGFGHWQEFRSNMSTHLSNISPNVVGVTEILAHRWGESGLVTQEEFDALKVRRQRIHRAQQALIFLPLCLLVALTARRRSDLAGVALALPLLLSGLSLAAYYFAFLVLLIPLYRRSTPALAALFSVEAVGHLLRLFETSDARLFIYRTLALLWLSAFLLIRLRRPKRVTAIMSPTLEDSHDATHATDP